MRRARCTGSKDMLYWPQKRELPFDIGIRFSTRPCSPAKDFRSYEEHQITERQTQGMVVDDFNTVVTTLTAGLRELPTDYAARVKNFLAEYLGSPRHPVPFGGRVEEFEYLDGW